MKVLIAAALAALLTACGTVQMPFTQVKLSPDAVAMMAPQTIDPCQSDQVQGIMGRWLQARSGRDGVPPGFYGFASSKGVPDGTILYEANRDRGTMLRCAVTLNTLRGPVPGVITLTRELDTESPLHATLTWMSADTFVKYASQRNLAINRQIAYQLAHPDRVTCISTSIPGIDPVIQYHCN